jgi:acyl phosphate:glycerol-3-phosphate acyltransferase
MSYLAACLLAYLLGSISFVPRPRTTSLLQVDQAAFRTQRLFDLWPVLAIDLTRGALAVGIAWLIAGTVAAHLAAICVVLGELAPPWPTRAPHPGLGVAAGALLVLGPLYMLISLAVYLLSLVLTRFVFWSTCLAALAFLLCLILFAAQLYLWLVVIGLAAMVCIQQPPSFKRRKGFRRPWWR